MSWGRYDDDMLDHEKWRRALRLGGDAVLATWERLRSWCSRRLTDGRIPYDMIEEVAQLKGSKTRAKCVRALIEAQLLEEHIDGSLLIVGYLERNPSKAEVIAQRERRAQSQQNRRRTDNVTGHASTSEPKRDSAPSHPIPAQSHPIPSERETRAPEALPDVVGLQRVGGVSRVPTLPSADPPQAFLDEALMGGVGPVQATSTWKHYWGAGLPERGVEKLYPWLVQRAIERQNSLARAPSGKGQPIAVEDPLAGWSPTRGRTLCARHGLDFGSEENAFRRSSAFKACRTHAEADEAWKRHLGLRARALQEEPRV